MLATDLNNPEFMGATNPDSRLAVEFYSRPVKNEFRTQVEGRPIFEDVDYVKIYVPGDATTTIDTPAREDHKARFPLQWAHYQNVHGGDAKQIGTPLSQWPLLTPSQVEELRHLKFFTVEQIAGASDSNIARIGMAGGIAATALRDRAQRFLQVARGEADLTARDQELEKLRAEAAASEERHANELSELKQQIAALTAAFAGTEPARRGRPRKSEAEPEQHDEAA